MDLNRTQLGNYKETNWITTLRTSYSYVVNDKIIDDMKSTNNEIVGLNFSSLKRMYGRMLGTNYTSIISLGEM